MDRKLDSRLPAHFREEWRLRNPPILAGLSLAELRRAQSGSFISDRSGESAVPDLLSVSVSLSTLADELVLQSPSAVAEGL